MTIVEPVSNGLGSDAFCILWDGSELHGLNASGPAPAAWTPDYFARKHEADATSPPKRGWDSVTVPGAVAGWVALSERFGKLPFRRPACSRRSRSPSAATWCRSVVQQKWAAAAALLAGEPGFAETFMPRGRAPAVGELFRFPRPRRERCG